MGQQQGALEGMVKTATNFWKNRPVLVTGADGIVGSWLIKQLLQDQAKVIAFIRDYKRQSELFLSGDIRRVKVVDGKLEDFKTIQFTIRRYKADTVFHLGAQTIVGIAQRDPRETFESNIRGTYNVLEACRWHPQLVKRIVVASSDKAYGAHRHLPYTEDMPLQGRFPYEVSKSCTDLLAQSYYHSYGLPLVVVRCGNIYGGGDLNFSRIVPGTIMAFLKRMPPIIRSDGKFVRDYIYVKDVCHAYMLVAEHLESKKLAGHSFNCSDETPMTVLDMVKNVARVMNCTKIKPEVLNQAHGEIRAQYLSATKIRRMLKWRPHYDLTQGLSETVDWYRKLASKSI